MGVNGCNQLIEGRLEPKRQRTLADQIGGARSDNVQAGHLPVLAVGDNFDQAFAAVEDQCLSVGVHRESSDEVINPLCPALLPGRSGDL